jgi:hypothetical protein
MIGVAIAKRVWREDSPQWKAAADARRRYEYQSKLCFEREAYSLAHTEDISRSAPRIAAGKMCSQRSLSAAGEDPNPPSSQ